MTSQIKKVQFSMSQQTPTAFSRSEKWSKICQCKLQTLTLFLNSGSSWTASSKRLTEKSIRSGTCSDRSAEWTRFSSASALCSWLCSRRKSTLLRFCLHFIKSEAKDLTIRYIQRSWSKKIKNFSWADSN